MFYGYVYEYWIDSRDLARYHLAAHATMQAQLGRRVFAIDMQDDEGEARCTRGEFETDGVDVNTAAGRFAAFRDCLYHLAGWAFEQALSPTVPPGDRAREDEIGASGIIGLLNQPHSIRTASLRHAKKVAAAIVAERDMFYRIVRVADVLKEKRVLTGGEVLEILRIADRSIADPRHRLASRMRRAQSAAVGKTSPARSNLAGHAIVHPASPVLRLAKLEDIGTTPAEAPRITAPTKVPLRAPERPRAYAEPASPSFGTPVEILNLSNRARRDLKMRGGILTIEQLRTYSEDELLRIRNLGQRSLGEIVRAMHDRGFTLRQK